MFLVAQLYGGILENNAFIYAKAVLIIYICVQLHEGECSASPESSLRFSCDDYWDRYEHSNVIVLLGGGVSGLRMDLLEHLPGATAEFPFIIYLSRSL